MIGRALPAPCESAMQVSHRGIATRSRMTPLHTRSSDVRSHCAVNGFVNCAPCPCMSRICPCICHSSSMSPLSRQLSRPLYLWTVSMSLPVLWAVALQSLRAAIGRSWAVAVRT